MDNVFEIKIPYKTNKTGSNSEEVQFLSSYDISKYDRPSVATDIVAFTMYSEKPDSHRKDAEARLSLLLIKRGEHPFKNCWALPGGFVRSDETVEECALREINEETGLTPASIIPIGVFSEIERDPRGRIISNAYVSIITENGNKIKGGNDAVSAKWFDVSYKQLENGSKELLLVSDDLTIKCILREKKDSSKSVDFDIIENSGLAFDHTKIIATAFEVLKEKIQKPDIAFDFLPEKFTLASLQKVHETLTGVSLLTPNFRRKMSDYVEETEEFTEGAGHRPARLFRRKQ